MDANSTTRLAVQALRHLDYDEARREVSYPVWLASTNQIVHPAMVAFARREPRDMSTATIVVALGELREDDFRCAQQLAAPAVMRTDGHRVEFYSATNGREQTLELAAEEIASIRGWRHTLGPQPLLQAKRGLRQLQLFPVDVNLLSNNRKIVEESLASRIGSVLEEVRAELASASGSPKSGGDEAARITFSAFAAVALAHRERGPTHDAGSRFVDISLRDHPEQFSWIESLDERQRALINFACSEIAEGIDYRSIDARILGDVYEHTLTSREAGKYYTPSQLATLLVHSIPFEAVPPHMRRVHDPSCGSGTFLVHAHERLSELADEENPDAVSRSPSHRFHLSGSDQDPAAIRIAQLRLTLADAQAHLEERDFLTSPSVLERSIHVIVGNPPWRSTNVGSAWEQIADNFVARSLAVLPEGGFLAFVVPASWLTSRSRYRGRTQLEDHCDLIEMWRLPPTTFSSARQSPAVVLAQKRRRGTPARTLIRYVPHEASLRETYASAGFRYGLAKTDPLRDGTVLGGFLSEILAAKRGLQRVGDVAEVRTGPQPHTNFVHTLSDSPPHWLLRTTRDVPYLAKPGLSHLVPFHYPLDCQGGSRRGASVALRPKIIIPESKDPKYPWRLRPILAAEDVMPTNKSQMVASSGDDPDIRDALLAIFSSGLASAWVSENTASQHIPATTLRKMPLPPLQQLKKLSRIGRRLRAADPDALPSLLRRLERSVLVAYGLSKHAGVADYLRDLLGTTQAPEGQYRYRRDLKSASGSDGLVLPEFPVGSQYVRVGEVLAVRSGQVKAWVSGESPEDGQWIDLPPHMPGFLLRHPTSFEATNDGPLEKAHYRVQLHSYLSLEELVDDIVGWDAD